MTDSSLVIAAAGSGLEGHDSGFLQEDPHSSVQIGSLNSKMHFPLEVRCLSFFAVSTITYSAYVDRLDKSALETSQYRGLPLGVKVKHSLTNR